MKIRWLLYALILLAFTAVGVAYGWPREARTVEVSLFWPSQQSENPNLLVLWLQKGAEPKEINEFSQLKLTRYHVDVIQALAVPNRPPGPYLVYLGQGSDGQVYYSFRSLLPGDLLSKEIPVFVPYKVKAARLDRDRGSLTVDLDWSWPASLLLIVIVFLTGVAAIVLLDLGRGIFDYVRRRRR